MSYSLRSQKRYTQKIEKPSKVLLVCVYDTIVFEITNQIIKSKFQKFGTIQKLLIFQKGQVTKFFVQYQDIQYAIKTKQYLDGTKLNQTICKMTIYYSNFTNVDIKHQIFQQFYYHNINNNTYDPNKIQKNYQYQHQDCTKSSNQDKQLFNQFFDEDENANKIFNTKYENNYYRSKTDNPKTLKDQIDQLNNFHQQSHHIIHQQDQLDHSIKKSIDSILDNTIYDQPQLQNQKLLKMKQQTDVRTSILCFIHKHNLQPQMVYNLFSNFGNISIISIKKDNVFIKFRTKQFAAIASTYLNNLTLLQNNMNLKQCPEFSDLWKPTQGQSCQCTYYDFSYDRFTAQRSITINPPSQTIHVSSIKRQICKQSALRNIFEQYGQVQKVHILQQSNQKNMALIKFKTMEESFNAIAHLHNQNFSGRKMQISFTKSKV